MIAAIQRGWQHPTWRNRLLYPVAVAYAGLMRARGYAYRCGMLRRYTPAAPLIVVGNLSVGGVGKTPLVLALADALRARGRQPGIISRGYGGRSRAPRQVRSTDDYHRVGDEPMLLARAGVPVVVGKNRAHCAQLLLAQNSCDILISDDGFQHLALRRALDIVVVDGERRFGNGWCLPAGPLREPPGALRRADFVVAHNPAAARLGDAEFTMTTRITQAVRLDAKQTRALTEFRGRRVHAVAALGNPQRFFQQLREFGINLIAHPFRDHHAFTADDFHFAAGGRAPIFMTEKDAVKCEPLIAAGRLRAADCWKIPLQTEVPEEFVEAVVARLQKYKHKNKHINRPKP